MSAGPFAGRTRSQGAQGLGSLERRSRLIELVIRRSGSREGLLPIALLRVMTWNVENLFAAGDADGPATEAALAAKIESLRAVIDAQRPHVLALQEVGGEGALQRLQQALTVPMPYQQLGIADERGIRVASSADEHSTTASISAPFPPASSQSR
jgi:hypothetical protein